MDSSRQAQQTRENVLFKFWNHFLNKLKNFFKIIVALGLCMQGGGGICAEQHAF